MKKQYISRDDIEKRNIDVYITSKNGNSVPLYQLLMWIAHARAYLKLYPSEEPKFVDRLLDTIRDLLPEG